MTHPFKQRIYVAASLLTLGLAPACTSRPDATGVEYAPEMYESLAYEPLRQTAYNTVNAFGINERTPAVATIPRGKLNYYTHIPKDSVKIAERTLHQPYAYTKENLEEGKLLYSRICLHCHGEQGNGLGLVGVKYKGVPNYAVGEYTKMNDAHIYHVIQWGKNRMMPHGSQVTPNERWKIAMYVRVLELGKGPDGLEEMIGKGPKITASDTTLTAAENGMTPTSKAGADTGSETPGMGNTKGRNGAAN